jgi:Fe-S oxidoreductase
VTTLDMFAAAGETLTEIANGPHIGGHAGVTEALMRRLCEKGLPLSHLADPRMMKRSLSTLQAYAREYELAFPDYVPMSLRKQVALVQSGDFFNAIGDDAEKVAETLGIAVTKRDGQLMCGVPAHALEASAKQLKDAFYRVKIVRAKKRKAAAHAA